MANGRQTIVCCCAFTVDNNWVCVARRQIYVISLWYPVRQSTFNRNEAKANRPVLINLGNGEALLVISDLGLYGYAEIGIREQSIAKGVVG